ncbi:MAG: hypothetical protein JXR68_11205 [Bacteroidales bacterium]|nr:hypothetical protein [Bacteroidales bacterium]
MDNEVIEIVEIYDKIYKISTKKDLLNASDLEFYFKTMETFYTQRQGQNVVVVYDISLLKAIDAKGRIKIGEWLKENTDLINDAVAGVCYVQTNVFQKIILQGIFTIKKPEWSHKIVKSITEAVEWGKFILDENN